MMQLDIIGIEPQGGFTDYAVRYFTLIDSEIDTLNSSELDDNEIVTHFRHPSVDLNIAIILDINDEQ